MLLIFDKMLLPVRYKLFVPLPFKGETEKKVDDVESTVAPATDADQDPMSSHETSAPVLSREDQSRKYVTIC